MKVLLKTNLSVEQLTDFCCKLGEQHAGYYGTPQGSWGRSKGFGLILEEDKVGWRTSGGNKVLAWRRGEKVFVEYEGARSTVRTLVPDGDRAAWEVMAYVTSEPHLNWWETFEEGIDRAPVDSVLRYLKTTRKWSIPTLISHPVLGRLLKYWGKNERWRSAQLNAEELRLIRRMEAARAWVDAPHLV